jgi:pyrimidine dimer DNA glycosylase
LWREGLLAQKVVDGGTRGYRHHPQLERFRARENPGLFVRSYLLAVYRESRARGYRFDRGKIQGHPRRCTMVETEGQLMLEWEHLMRKLKKRSPDRYRRLRSLEVPEAHPLFRIVPGEVRRWERLHPGGPGRR